jgi:hypothetical protein
MGDALSAVGGLLTLIAFFLPWFLIPFFGFPTTLSAAFFINPFANRSISGDVFVGSTWVLLLSAYALSILSLVALGRRLSVWHRIIPLVAGLLAAVLFTPIAALLGRQFFPMLVGFWLTLLGYLLALVGCLLVLRSRSHSQESVLRETGIRTGDALSAVGGLLTLIAFFLPWFPVPFFGFPPAFSPAFFINPFGNRPIKGDIFVGSAWVLLLSAYTLSILSLVALGRQLSVWHRIVPNASGLLATVLFVLMAATLGEILQLLVGFWLTLLGYLLALAGSLLVLRGKSHSQRSTSVAKKTSPDLQ